jgi:hypothetical protein
MKFESFADFETVQRQIWLPPGYGFSTDGEYIDIWFDERYLKA